MADLTSDIRNRLQSSQFGLPGSRKYPMTDKAHAANAKARATQMVKRGKLSPASAAKIKTKANRMLGTTKGPGGVTQDINAPGNRAPSPAQDDINNWKSNPVARGPKVKPDSQGKGEVFNSGKGASYAGQEKHHGTEAPSANKKSQAKRGGITEANGKSFKGQPKHRDSVSAPTGNGKRYSNGSSSFDSMAHVIRDH